MNMVLIAPYDLERIKIVLPGVYGKIEMQKGAFDEAGLICDLKGSSSKDTLSMQVKKRLPFFSDGVRWGQIADPGSFDCYYIRKPDFISRDMLKWLAEIRRVNPSACVLLELPTYPYDGEGMRLGVLPKLAKDKLHRGKLNKYLDRIVDLSRHDDIFGIPTLQIINGIDLSRTPRRKPSASKESELNVICTAAFSGWHGVDRFLAGLKEYRCKGGSRRVRLHLLGAGPALASLKRQTEDSGLSDDVIFYGQCDRHEIDRVANACSLAIECLGIHRKFARPRGTRSSPRSMSSSLKSREYLARGIPFVYAWPVDVIEDSPVDFCLRVPADDSPVNIASVVSFHDELYARESEQALIDRIRAYAESHVGMDTAMKNVIDYIKENCGDDIKHNEQNC